MGDAPPAKCEICGEGPVERVLYPVAGHFKGSGFYSPDYGRGSRKKEPSTDGAGADSAWASKNDSTQKPETKTLESNPPAANRLASPPRGTGATSGGGGCARDA